MDKQKVRDYIDTIHAEGRYWFTKQELLDKVSCTECAVTFSLNRLNKANRIKRIRNGFYIIIPIENQNSRIIPATWFIDDLMKFLKRPYYVGLLSAAALQGASHQQPQVFQVVTDQVIRNIEVNGLRIKFFMKGNVEWGRDFKSIKTKTGYIDISSPELTALDLIRYAAKLGSLNQIATVLKELTEHIKNQDLANEAEWGFSVSYIQRLGFILDKFGHNQLTANLHKLVLKAKPFSTVLDPRQPRAGSKLNEKWQIIINENIEVDEV